MKIVTIYNLQTSYYRTDRIKSPCVTVRKQASMASLKAAKTFCFFSLNLSSMAGVIIAAYCVNFFRRPVAKKPMHLAAEATTITLASFIII